MNFSIILALLILSTIVSAVGNYLVLNFAKNLGIRNNNNVVIRWSNESKPSLGGVSMYVVFLFTGLIVAVLFIDLIEDFQKEYLGLFIAATVAFCMGLADDAYNTRPFLKMSVQIFCGLVFVFTNNTFIVSNIEGVNYLFTIFWVVTLMNSLNMLDNMDGITATTCACVLIACLSIYIATHGWGITIWAILMYSMIGTLIGFLMFNVHPSRMFMGDGGSQFLGVAIAFFTGKMLLSQEMMGSHSFNLNGLLLALVSLTPAAVDSITVVINRMKKGQSPMVGGKDHTTHHLVYSGKTDIQVWYVFLIIGVVSSIIVCLSYAMISDGNSLGYVIGIIWFLAVFWYLYRNTILHKQVR
jgi:UDP-GlcNAc:undecaprenyl-phosphate/decaprenyl-phosphate GlcNAc-1-phosphate transferase